MTKLLMTIMVVLGFVAVWLFYCNKSLKNDLTAANAEIAGLTASVMEMKDLVGVYAKADKEAKEFEKELINDTNTDNLYSGIAQENIAINGSGIVKAVLGE